MEKIWSKVKTERVFTCPYMKVDKSLFENNLGYADDFYSLDFGDWVHVIPLLEDNRVLMIELYRFGIEGGSLEFPGGQIESGHSPECSAKNELTEETGYECDNLVSIGWVHPNPAIQKNKCHFFVAENIKKITSQRLEPAEDITVKIVEREELASLISAGLVTHSLAITAYFKYLDYIKR